MKFSKKAYFGLGLGLLFLGQKNNPSYALTTNNTGIIIGYKQAMLHVDTPHGDYDVNSSIIVSGWALNSAGTSKIEIFVNGTKLGNATLNVSRPDVNRVFPGYVQQDNSGFSFALPKNYLAEGTHNILVYVTTNDGEVISETTTITVSTKDSRMIVDTPEYEVNQHNEFVVSGWALNSAGTKKVDIFIDGQSFGEAELDIYRPDVNNAFPGYPQENNSGYALTIPEKSLTLGNHQLSVVVTDNNNHTTVITKNIIVIRKVGIMHIDTPTSGQTYNNNDIDIHGWFVNMGTTETIEIYVDNTMVGNATLNLYRPDVDAYLPNYSTGDSSGFKFTIDKNLIAPGKHAIKLRGITKDGEVIEMIHNITMNKPAAMTTIDVPTTSHSIFASELTIAGWALNASTIKNINIYVDQQLIGTTTTGESRFDVDSVFPNYPEGTTSGFNFVTDLSQFSMGKHQLSVEAIGVDGSTMVTNTSFIIGGIVNPLLSGNSLDHYVAKEYEKGSAVISYLGGWTAASYEDIYYYMNPQNFVTDSQYRYMFMKLNFTPGINIDDLDKTLANKGILANMGRIFYDAGQKANVNPIYLIAHASLETGNGTSTLAKGVIVTELYDEKCNVYQTVAPTLVYNFFGIGAVDACAVNRGATTAYLQGWDTVEKAITGGASWIGSQYINNNFNQDTLYKMRYNYTANWKQYATDIAWAAKQTATIRLLVEQMDNSIIYFEIPTYPF